MHCCFWS
ncbi:hypothetical protein LINGRAHAP2_LOCUS28036 [Linum grandiflorum]